LIKQIHKNGFLFLVDTRVKWAVVLMMTFVILVIPAYSWAFYLLFFSIFVALSIISGLSLLKVFKRTFFIEMPLMVMLIPLPILNRAMPTLMINLFGKSLQLSLNELLRVSALMLRSWLIIFNMVLFTLTTPADELLSSLLEWHMPPLLVAIILLMWRYLTIFIGDAQKMIVAREMRSIRTPNGKRARFLQNVKSTGSILANLLMHAYEQSERIYQAMQLRGFDGTLRSFKKNPLQTVHKIQMSIVVIM